MKGPSTLRGRLIAAVLAVLLLALIISTLLDMLGAAEPGGSTGSEALQDALVLACFSVPALVLIWLISSWSLRPLARISQQACSVGPANPSARLSETGLPAEIVPLVAAVNGALDRMAEAVAAERRFTENAAHELRTPLAVLSLRLQRGRPVDGGDMLLDWSAVEADLEQLTRLVSQMLDLARKENAGRAASNRLRPVVNLSRIAREACAMILPMAESRNRPLGIIVPDTLSIVGNADDLRDVLVNLLENAVLHGRGRIDLTGRAEAARIVLCVSDEGPGLPRGQSDALFKRFRKSGTSSGSGLGLAIVREVVRNHGGEAAFLPETPCRVELIFPLPAP